MSGNNWTMQRLRGEPRNDRAGIQSAGECGASGVAGCIAGWIMNSTGFYRAYLVAFLFVLGWSLGSLGLLMLQHLTGGHWGILIRRPLEAASRVSYLLPFLFLPL